MSVSPDPLGDQGVGRRDDSAPASTGRIPQQPVPPGTGSAAPPPAARPRTGRGPWLISAAAAAIAVLSMTVGIYAVMEAQEARRQADLAVLGAKGAPAPTKQAQNSNVSTPGGRPTGSAARPSTTPADVLNPLANYDLKYSGQKLNPQATSNEDAYIDLDEPRVGAEDVADISLALEYNSTVPYFQFINGTVAARSASHPLEPKACAELIRTSRLPASAKVPAQRDTTLCLATSLDEARQQGIKQRIVLLKVTALSREGIPSLEVTAWEVPD